MLQQAAPASAASPRPWQVAPLSAAAGAVALALGAASKHRKPIATRRHFFGDSTPPSAKATSYKDYKDLGKMSSTERCVACRQSAGRVRPKFRIIRMIGMIVDSQKHLGKQGLHSNKTHAIQQ
jgi:hypothetical protein